MGVLASFSPFYPIHFSLITHHFFIIYLVILQMNEHIRLKRTKNVRGVVHNNNNCKNKQTIINIHYL